MNKKKAQLDIAKEMGESPLVDFMIENGRTVLYVISALLALFFIAYLLSARSTTKAEIDYFNAEIDFHHFQQNFRKFEKASLNPSYVQLNAILERRPDLQGKYDAPIAQILVEQGEGESAFPFAERTFQRVEREKLFNHLSYAKATLAISLGKYQEALQQALALNESLEKIRLDEQNQLSSEVLYLYNLLRIAFLNRELNDKAAELAAWKSFEKYGEVVAKASLSDREALFQQVVNSFSNGKATLFNFIEKREAFLGN
jgi:hypothetical protein